MPGSPSEILGNLPFLRTRIATHVEAEFLSPPCNNTKSESLYLAERTCWSRNDHMNTSGVSTSLIAWWGSPHVTKPRPVERDHTPHPLRTTLTLGLHERIASVYDTSFRDSFLGTSSRCCCSLPPNSRRFASSRSTSVLGVSLRRRRM